MTTWDLACLIKSLYDQATNKYVANVMFECVDVPVGLFSPCCPFPKFKWRLGKSF